MGKIWARGKNGRARGRHAKELPVLMPVLYAAMIAAHLGSPEIIKQQINSGTGSFKGFRVWRRCNQVKGPD